MVKPVLRLTGLLTFLTVLLVLSITVISPYLPDGNGVLFATSATNNDSVNKLYLDLDTGVTLQQSNEIISSTIPFERTISLIHNASTDTQTVYFVRENDTIALERIINNEISVIDTYTDLYPVEAYWNPNETILYVIDTANLKDTTIYAISIADGQRTPLVTIEGFVAGFAQPSPDMRYLLVRALDNTGSSNTSIAGRTLYLVDLETLDVRNLEQPNGAYWSPDSSKIAFGTVSERRFMLDISVYDVPTGQITNLDVQASHVDLDVFESVRRSGLKWSPDNNGMAILNQYEDILHYITLDGTYTFVAGRYLRPLAWSPNNRHLIAIGEDDKGNNGVFIVDFETQHTILIENQNPDFINLQGAVTWSPDGKVVLISSWTSISLYDLQGQPVSLDIFRAIAPDLQIIPQSVSWMADNSR